MELYQTNHEKLMVMSAVVNGETKFLQFKSERDPYSSNLSHCAKYNLEPDYSIVDVKFNFVNQDKATLFKELSDFIKVFDFDKSKNKLLEKLLSDNNLNPEDVVVQNIEGSNVTISSINLGILFH